MWKRVMNTDVKKSIQLGCSIPGLEGYRMDVLYKTPTPEVARENMISKVEKYLRLRYQNQRTFRLPAV